MAYRFNERNIGSHSLEGAVKSRKTAKKKLSNGEIALLKEILMRVYDALEYDETLGMYVDNGNVVLSLDKSQWQALYDIANERKF